VTLLDFRAQSGGGSVPVKGQKVARRMFTGGGIQYPFRTESPGIGENLPQRRYEEPSHAPLPSVPSLRGDIAPSGPAKKTQNAPGASVPAKKGPDFPSGNEASGRAGERLGVKGPLASRGVLYCEFPDYPEWAQKKGIEARVKLKFWVEPDGDVDEVVAVKRGYMQLDNLAVQALKRWRFEPLPPGQGRARQWGTIEMNFELK
jgi:protein TonB